MQGLMNTITDLAKQFGRRFIHAAPNAASPVDGLDHAPSTTAGRSPRSSGRPIAISDWVITEFSAALSMKLRSGQIKATHRADALAMLTRLSVDSFTILLISGLQFRTAARFADQHALGLRAGDALHLAICADHGATLCTLDRRLSDAGPVLGVKAMLL